MTPALMTSICGQLAEGQSLRAVCEAEEICERVVYRRLRDDAEFSQEYARARKTWADAKLEEIVAISKDANLGADHKRIQIDTLKWAMGKLNGKYSDKLVVEGKQEVTHRYNLETLAQARLEQLECILADASGGSGGAGETEPVALH